MFFVQMVSIKLVIREGTKHYTNSNNPFLQKTLPTMGKLRQHAGANVLNSHLQGTL
jgi:hypothetical protein